MEKAHSSLECVKRCQRRECDVLKHGTEILFGLDSENQDLVQEVRSELSALSSDIDDLKLSLRRVVEINERNKIAAEELQEYETFLGLAEHEDFQRLFPTPGKVESVSFPTSKPEKIGKGSIACISEVTSPEYETVPFYMKGRIKLDEVNDLVSSINSTLFKKYSILWDAHPIKYKEKQLQFQFKQQQHSCPGLTFFTEEDLKEFGYLRNTIRFCKLINILRAARRIREQRSDGLRKLMKKQLKHGAIPCIFCDEINDASTDQGNTITSIERRDDNLTPIKNFHGEHSNQAILPLVLTNSTEEELMILGSPGVNTVESKEDSLTTQPALTNDNVRRDIFTSFSTGEAKIKLPPRSWSCHVEEDIIVFQGNAQYSDNLTLWYQKQIVLYPDLKIDILLLQKYHTSLTDLNSQTDIEKVIDNIDRMKLCIGGPPILRYSNVQARCCYKDVTGHWRHNKCTLEVEPNGVICKLCASLEGTLRKHIEVRKRKCMKDHIYIPSPSKKRKVQVLRNAARIQTQALKRKKRALAKLQIQVEGLRKDITEVEDKNLEELLNSKQINETQMLLIKECISAAKRKKVQSTRYSHEWILVCLLLRIKHKATYNFLRQNKLLPLPAISTIKSYLRKVKMECGFEKDFFDAFSKKLATLPQRARHGTLLMDEMMVRKSVTLISSKLTFDGLQDDGSSCANSTKEMADHALVIMFSSLEANFHQPVATFASKNPTNGTTLAKIILQAITEVENAGGYVDGIICDGATTNRKMWSELNITGSQENPSYFFDNPVDEDRKIYVFSDTLHLIKCARNRLKGRNLKMDGELIKWKYYSDLYAKEITNAAHERVCPKLTINHVNVSKPMAMRVFLATQVFSGSVAAGLSFYKKKFPTVFQNCEKTIEFTQWMNDLFDALNRRFPKEGIRKNGKDMQVPQNSLKKLNSWQQELIDGKIAAHEILSTSTMEGFRVTILSTLSLCNDLLEMYDFSYVLTAKLNQDRLEQFFGIIRQASGCNDHPSIVNFLQLYKLLSLYKLIKPPRYGNCSVQNSDISSKISASDFGIIFKKAEKSDKSVHIHKLLHKIRNIIGTTEYECEDVFSSDIDYSCDDIIPFIVFYVSGFLARKMLKHFKCEECKNFFASSECSMFLPEAELVHLKNRGSLFYVQENLFRFTMMIEEKFCMNISSEDNNRVYENTVEDLLHDPNLPLLTNSLCKEHADEIITEVMHYDITMRMRQWADKETNDIIKRNKNMRKLARFSQT